MTGNTTIWKLVAECAEKLSAAGLTPFTRGDLASCIQRTHPEYGASSINPIIQGLTDNTQGGVPSPLGKTLLHRVARGRYVLVRDASRHEGVSPPKADKPTIEKAHPKITAGTTTPITRVGTIKLRFSEAEIITLANRYSYTREDQSILDFRDIVQQSGYLTKEQLKQVALWKAPRAAGHVDRNDGDFVRETTGYSFAAKSERTRIEVLTLLDGVNWPTASVILHLFHKDPYPILDFRALWSVGLDVPNPYTFQFWWPYVEYTRSVAQRNGVDMRTLDRALWQFSKENQSGGDGNNIARPKHDAKIPNSRRAQRMEASKQPPSKKLSPEELEGTVYWVSCVSQKRSTPAKASDLYVSDWFTKARAYVESRSAPWRILSAKYGLVPPDEVIEPYDLTLNTLGVAERKKWSDRVMEQFERQRSKPKRIVLLAGARYREFIEPRLRDMGIEIVVPMEGLRIGEQLSWLNKGAAQNTTERGIKEADSRLAVNEQANQPRIQSPRNRLEDLKRFYELLDRFRVKLGGERTLADCNGRMNWPDRGIYFFFEPGENQSDSGAGLRVTRVGTHALSAQSGTSLWTRLSQHRGTQKTGGGNHRGSIFRLIIGAAIKNRDQQKEPSSWGVGNDPGAAAKGLNCSKEDVNDKEEQLERMVSEYIGQMPFLWLDIGDPPGRDSLRGVIERNSIALLSNFSATSLDPASAGWLGQHSDRERVRASGLWNNKHVDEPYDPGFLITLEQLIAKS